MTRVDLGPVIRKQPFAFVCAVIVLAGAVAFYFRMDAVDEARDAFEKADREAKLVSQNARNTAGLAEATAELQEAGRQFDARVIRASQLANNLQFFYRLEKETGVRLVDVRQLPIPPLKPGAPKAAFSPVPFIISFQGDYSQIHHLLRRIEAGQHFIRFTQVGITKAGTAGEVRPTTAGTMSATIHLEFLGTP